jgi:hypothetical protein
MTFVDVTNALAHRLGTTSGEPPARAAIGLLVAGWSALADTDPAGWDRFGLAVLAAADHLAGLPDTVAPSGPPVVADPATRSAVRHLAVHLVHRLDREAATDTWPTADRLAFAAAVAELRTAVAALP